ncbi:zinc finger CCCH domain-containing protein 55-like isoform X3 [Alnus glutinosa]|uniref:zinc finger CCCH domain-containing protein 55-like isoform X3 n=1 Tax=Alnus glutinosa TaxID=3517 RepID=UPI002D7696DD|nr:zinc finger CCCH domain-containing protein 55-like isoform X3 [Alnus glutinosa]
MDPFEATNIVLSKIKFLEPENASKIMGYLLIQDLGENDLIRLAFGSEAYLRALIAKAKTHLGLPSSISSTPSAPSSPSPLNPIARPTNANPFSHSSPRLPNGFDFSKNQSSPPVNSWPLSGFPSNPISPKSSPLLSYDNIRAGALPLRSFPQHKNGFESGSSTSTDLLDEHQLNEYLSFLNDSSSSSKNEDFIAPMLELGHGVHNWAHSGNNGDSHFHRRSYSENDVCFGSEEPGLGTGYKPCLYFARGFCKNGSSCKFVHGGFADSVDGPHGPIVGSPSKFEEFELHEEMMRLKAAQQQRLAAQQLMAGPSPSAYNKYMNFLLQQQNDPQRAAAAAAAFMMGEDLYKFGRCRPERNDFLAMASAEKANSASRQIYLTFPADSTFKDEDVSEYFSNFGPVQDVRIPYQQKRMFGFVTFVYPETVKLILAKGNPHFICDSRVLVKPYKEKGKVPDKRQQHQQQQLERGEFSPSLSPSGLDSREPYDLNLGARMFYNTQEMLLRKKLEDQAELQQAIELQGRRLMNLQLPDLDERIHHHQRSLSVGSHAPLTPLPCAHINQNVILPSDSISEEVADGQLYDGHSGNPAVAAEHLLQQEVNPACIHNNGSVNSKEESFHVEEFDLPKRFCNKGEHGSRD